MNCGSTWAVVSQAVLDGALATVVYGGSDGRFTILEVDRGPREDDVPACLDCVLDLQPGLGRGLDVAKEHGPVMPDLKTNHHDGGLSQMRTILTPRSPVGFPSPIERVAFFSLSPGGTRGADPGSVCLCFADSKPGGARTTSRSPTRKRV